MEDSTNERQLHHRDKIANLNIEALTKLTHYGSFILTLTIIGIILIANILERWVFRWVYGKVYQELERPDKQRRLRSFTYFHVGAMMMSSILCIGCYPFFILVAGPAGFSTPVGSSGATVGDLMFITCQLYSGYYIFELCYRTKFASYINIAHHIALLVIGQTAVYLFGDTRRLAQAALEFYMCMFWGMFDVLIQFPIYISMIIWRVKRGNARLLFCLAFTCAIWEVIAALVEIAITVYLLYRSWASWDLVWRVITPLIFSLWIIAQLYSASRFFCMGRQEYQLYKKRKLHEAGGARSEGITEPSLA